LTLVFIIRTEYIDTRQMNIVKVERETHVSTRNCKQRHVTAQPAGCLHIRIDV